MNLVQLVKYITNVAKEHPLVKTVIEGDVYQLNSEEVKYGVFCITQPMNNVIKEDNIMKYTFTIFYVDRLTEDESNKLVIQTDGINTIHEVFNYIKTNAPTSDINIPITFTTFTEKFADKCAGAYATVTVEVDDETGDCDFYYEDILIEPIPGTTHTTVLDNYYTKVEVDDLIHNATHDADMVDYDNSQTGLPATTAQEAIDQLYAIAIDDPAFKAWLQANATYLAVLLDEQVTNPENKYLNALRQWVEIAIGGGSYLAPLYMTTVDSITPGFKQLNYIPQLGETELTITIRNETKLLRRYIYDQQLATTTIDSGNWIASGRYKISSTAGVTKFKIIPFLYHIDGTRTELFTAYSDEINNKEYLDLSKTIPFGTIYCLETDRLGFDVYIETTSNSNITLYSLIGDGHPAYFATPLRLRHDGLRGLNDDPNFLHINQEEKNKLINNYTYKIENVLVSTWSDSTAYTSYPFEATINIANLKESDSVEVIYNIIDAGSANYAPGGELYEGYIKIFAKVNTEITIPTLVVTKIDL